jgi:hypothetical protein
MVYLNLWDLRSGNRLVELPTESEVLDYVRAFLSTGEERYLTELSLGAVDEHGDTRLIAEGTSLAARALANTSITPRDTSAA